MAGPRRRRRRSPAAGPGPPEIEFTSRVARERSPAAMALLARLEGWGGGSGKIGLVVGGVLSLLAGLGLAFGNHPDLRRNGLIFLFASLALVAESALLVWSARQLARVLVAGHRRVRPALLGMLIGGIPFVLLGLGLIVVIVTATVEAQGPPSRIALGMLVFGLIFLAVPALAAYGLLRYRAVWDEMERARR